MKLDDGILLVLKACGSSPVGRTALQKLMYFVSELGAVDTEFNAHYYGPYSQEVANEVASLVDLNFLDEYSGVVYPSGNVGYAYRITDEGREVLPDGNGAQETINRVVSSAIRHFSLNPQLLATAAKVHFILDESKEPMIPSTIRERAGRLGWNIDEKGIINVIEFLRDLDLVKTGS